MLIQELRNVLTEMDPTSEALVVLFTDDGRRETFDILAVSENNGTTHIEISEIETWA